MAQKFTGSKKDTLAWYMLGILALAFVISYFHRFSLSVVLDFLIIDLKIENAAMAGTLVGTYAVVYLFMQIPSGVLADLWGPRKTVTMGMITAFAGCIVFAAAPTLALAFVGRFLVSAGVAVVFVSILKFQTTWFRPAQFATISGLTVLAGNLGGILATTPLAMLVTGFGWRNSFYIIAAASLVIGALCWFLVHDTPEEVENERTGSVSKKISGHLDIAAGLKTVFRNPDTWVLFICSFGVAGTLFAFAGTWSIFYLMQIYGFSRNAAAGCMMAVSIGKIVGFPLIGLISDKMMRRKLPLLTSLLIYVVLWALLYGWNGGKPPKAALFPIFFLLGLVSGAVILIPVLAKELNDLTFSGLAMSVINMAPFAGMAVLQPLLGYILDMRWEGAVDMGVKVYPLAAYRLILAVCLIFPIISFCFACRIKETKGQNIAADRKAAVG